MTVVEVSDRGDWQRTYLEIMRWLKANYPDVKGGITDGRKEWDVQFGLDTILMHFEDPNLAMMFKLTWA